ncbi:hypothetical protein IJI31_01065 [bacterium]|nr:hypothetical protein [bacterium]
MTVHSERVKEFLAKKSKAATVLEMLFDREYVTCSDIINYGCENTPLVFTTCPHKLIEYIRKHFGVDFVKDREVKFFRTYYKADGKPYRVSETYKQYFLGKIE